MGVIGSQVKYGIFLRTVVDFVIIAIVFLLLVKQAAKLKEPAVESTAAAPATP